jgi:hypothetical protein
MDAGQIAAHFGASLASGLVITMTILVLLLPVSFTMNRFIYHHWLMRLIVGAVAGFLGIGAFLAILALILFKVIKPSHYFGLFPLTNVSAGVTSGWIMPTFLGRFLNPVLHPFQLYWDEPAYMTAVEEMLAKEGQPVVDEELFAMARDAAATPPNKVSKDGKEMDWTSYLQKMEKIKAMVQAKKKSPLTPE